MRRAVSRRLRLRTCGTHGTATFAGALMERFDNSNNFIRTSERISQSSDSTTTILTPVEHLDLATVIKVSEAVSGEIVLEKLVDTLMRTAIEHAGAERGLLILPRGDEYRIEAEVTTQP